MLLRFDGETSFALNVQDAARARLYEEMSNAFGIPATLVSNQWKCNVLLSRGERTNRSSNIRTKKLKTNERTHKIDKRTQQASM